MVQGIIMQYLPDTTLATFDDVECTTSGWWFGSSTPTLLALEAPLFLDILKGGGRIILGFRFGES
jgi:hypothetical protein